MRKIILASTSVARQELFQKLRLPFTVVASQFNEDMTISDDPATLVRKLSLGKARAVAPQHQNHIIIGVDSVVVFGALILGKPATMREATNMLRLISGKRVEIVTGYTIVDSKTNKSKSEVAVARVWMKPLAASEIRAYVQSDEPMNKAGAFAIQGLGSVLIKKIEGDFFGAVGLPLYALARSLKQFGVRVL